MNNQVILYMHSGSKNHGCEALARTVSKEIGVEDVILCSNRIEEESIYGVDKQFSKLIAKKNYKKYSIHNIVFKIISLIAKNKRLTYAQSYRELLQQVNKGDIAISIGGDSYCYSEIPNILAYLNKELQAKGAKTALIGCSIEPEVIKNPKIKEDLKRYSLITARESITYQTLLEERINTNTKLIPDSAFVLPMEEVTLPEQIKKGKVIGINVSPLIQRLENGNNITYENYVELIKHIIATTEDTIALIPHVVWKDNDDRIPLTKLYEEFKETGRVVLIPDHNCMQLKYIISQCRIFIGARTHATIAAYSTGVPTLVVGYSIKAKGIAKDLFGTYENYVLPVQNLKEKQDLCKAFDWIMEKEQEIRNHLQEIMPSYQAKVKELKKEVEKIREKNN